MNGTEQDKTTGRSPSSLSSITNDIFRNALNLLRNEIRVATAEITHKVSNAGKVSTMMTVGGFILYAGLLFVLTAAMIGLSLVIPLVWAALAVGGGAMIIGGILLIIGKNRLRMDVYPSETIDTAQEDAKWMRNRLS